MNLCKGLFSVLTERSDVRRVSSPVVLAWNQSQACLVRNYFQPCANNSYQLDVQPVSLINTSDRDPDKAAPY